LKAHGRAVTVIYSTLEPGIFIIAGCMATLRPLLGGRNGVSTVKGSLTGLASIQSKSTGQSEEPFKKQSILQTSGNSYPLQPCNERLTQDDDFLEHMNRAESQFP
jgi:hypothetical protein